MRGVCNSVYLLLSQKVQRNEKCYCAFQVSVFVSVCGA